jgi:hypothetical protein
MCRRPSQRVSTLLTAQSSRQEDVRLPTLRGKADSVRASTVSQVVEAYLREAEAGPRLPLQMTRLWVASGLLGLRFNAAQIGGCVLASTMNRCHTK